MAIGKKDTVFLNQLITVWKGIDESHKLEKAKEIVGIRDANMLVTLLNDVSK